MKLKILFLVAIAMSFVQYTSAQVTVTNRAPTNLLLDESDNNTTLINIEPTSAQGSLFQLDTAGSGGAANNNRSFIAPNTLAQIDGVSFNLGVDSTATGATVLFFEGGNLAGASGAVTATDFLASTGATPLAQETFTLPTLTSNYWIRFNLTNPLQVNSSQPIGFFVFAMGGYIVHREGEDGSGRLSYEGAGVITAADRNFNFLIFGSEGQVTILGDVNLDGVVDFFDIAPFIAALVAGGNQAEADINMDGEVNFFDIAPFITLLSGQ